MSNVVLFGLCNALATFQRQMERFLGPLNAVDVVVYFDNVLMFALDAGVLIDTIPEVLQLQTVIAGRKCKFFIFEIFIERVHYL